MMLKIKDRARLVDNSMTRKKIIELVKEYETQLIEYAPLPSDLLILFLVNDTNMTSRKLLDILCLMGGYGFSCSDNNLIIRVNILITELIGDSQGQVRIQQRLHDNIEKARQIFDTK